MNPLAVTSTPLVLLPRRATQTVRRDILSCLVAGYVALLPFQIEVMPRLRFAPADCFLVLAVLLVPWRLKYRKEAWSAWHVGLAVIFVIGTLIAALASGRVTQYALLNKDAGLLALFAAYGILTSAVTEWGQLRSILRVFVVSVVGQNVVGIAALVAATLFGVQTPLTTFDGRRLCGMLVDPNAYGGLVVLALVLCEASSSGATPVFRGWFLQFSRATLALGVLLTFSRTAWASLCLALLLLLASRFRTVVRIVFSTAAACTVLLILAGDPVMSLFRTMTVRPMQAEGPVSRGRIELIEHALAVFEEHPVLGGGAGTFFEAEGAIVHNTAIWFLAEFGIVGLLVFAGYVVWFFLKGRYASRYAPDSEKPVVRALLLGHVTMLGLSMGIEAFYQRHWWLVMALLAASYSNVLRQRRSR